MNKRGIVLENVIFLVLNLVFFVVVLFFITTNNADHAIYEQIYSKQISLLIDRAKPGTKIAYNIRDLRLELASHLTRSERANQQLFNDLLKKKILVDNKNKKVVIGLTKKSKGYSYPYFSNYTIEKRFQGNYLILEVKDE